MTRSDDRRAEILDRLADHILDAGLLASSLRPLAKAGGVSDRMLLYYFKDKAEIIAETLDVITARLTHILEDCAAAPRPLHALRGELMAVLSAEAIWPYIRLWLEIAALAARGDGFYRIIGNRIARGFLGWGAAQLDSAPGARAADAAALLVSIEGMLLLRSVGLDDVGQLALER